MTDGNTTARRYSDRAVRHILSRAIQFEGTGTVTRDELMRIAADSGINLSAMDAAITEYDTHGIEGALRSRSLRTLFARYTAIGGSLGVAAAIPTLVFETNLLLFMPAAGIAALMFAGAAATRPADPSSGSPVRRFLAKNLGLWVGLGAAAFATVAAVAGFPLPHVHRVVVTQCVVILSGVSSIIGSVIAARKAAPAAPETPGGARVASKVRAFLANTLRRWADRLTYRQSRGMRVA